MANPFSGLKVKWSNSAPISVEDYRALARKRLPYMVWAYIDGAADDLATLRGNRLAFGRWAFLPRFLTGKEGTGLATSIGGRRISLPVYLSPTGMCGLTHWSGEIAMAQAAERAGSLCVVSGAASYLPEEIHEATRERHFFQLYPWSNALAGRHDLTDHYIQRVQDAGYQGLFVTVDVPTHGNREAERRRSLGTPPVFTPGQLLEAALHPRWLMGYLRHQRVAPRLMTHRGGLKGIAEAGEFQLRAMRPELNWDDIKRMRDRWNGPFYIKGLLHPDDAEKAIEIGATGIVVSNHGGRQLDGSEAALDAMVKIADRVNGRAEILLDGGIRRGADVVKALCLGATAVGIGRPTLYGLGAAGSAGVEHILEIFRQEIARTLTLLGVTDVSELNRSMLTRVEPYPFGDSNEV